MEKITNYRALLGEGDIWNHITSELYWVDIEEKKLMILDPEKNINKTFEVDMMIGTVVPAEDGNVLIALEDGIYRLDLTTQKKVKLASNPDANTRFNDGKCDPSGSFWAGTMDYRCKHAIGNLYRLNSNGSLKKMITGITVSNGITWSPDGKKMYYIDTPTQKVVEYDFDITIGDITFARDAVVIPHDMGMPDGCTIDEEGMLWIAMWGGASVTRWNPHNGELLTKIDLPVLYVTSVAFGGKNLDILYITTASQGDMNNPDAGYLFMYGPGVKGIKTNHCDYTF